jgi:hypothetical protein
MPSLCSTVQCSGELLAEAVTLGGGGEREESKHYLPDWDRSLSRQGNGSNQDDLSMLRDAEESIQTVSKKKLSSPGESNVTRPD